MMLKRFTFKLTDRDRLALDRLAVAEGESASVVVRQMIRKAAHERGLLPGDANSWVQDNGGHRREERQ